MAKKPGKPKRFELYIPTPDDWYPNCPGDMVRVCDMDTTLSWKRLSIRTCVWGADDCGMDRDEFFETLKEKDEAYEQRCREVKDWTSVSKKTLKSLGFVTA